MRVIWPTVAATLTLAASAAAQQPFQPWDGTNPFHCELQQLGQGVDYPDPGADPLCIEFDKTQQNVAPDLGLVDFLSNEPARVAAAIDKCFYFQHDHWTGSIVQDQAPELWHWDGSYFFDKARALGGVHVENFRIGGQPFDGAPYAPPEYQPYFEEGGGGGAWFGLDMDADPSCVEMVDTPAEAARIYRSAPVERGCADPGGNVGRHRIGALRLGASRERLGERFGKPSRKNRRWDRWCALGGGAIGAAYRKSRAGLIVTSSPGHNINKVGPKSRARRARNRLRTTYRFSAAGARVYTVAHDGATAYAGIKDGKVRWLALRSAKLMRTQGSAAAALRAYLHR